MKTYTFLACFFTSHITPHTTPGYKQYLKLLLGVCNTKERGDLSTVYSISLKPADMANLEKPFVKEPRLDCDEVFETLGHLAARYCEVAGVEEVAHPHVIVKVSLRLKKNGDVTLCYEPVKCTIQYGTFVEPCCDTTDTYFNRDPKENNENLAPFLNI
jgi:hypothetical protein